jgi:glycerophosphoryl diester phosphodiesterase
VPDASTIRGLLVAAGKQLSAQLGDLLVFALLFQLASSALLAPFAAWVSSRLIARSGSVAVSNEAIAAFFLSPGGLLALLGMGGLLLAILYAQQCGIFAIALPGLGGRRVSPLVALRRGLGVLPRLVGLGALQLAGAALCLLPVAAAAGLVYALLLGEHDVNFYLSRRPPELLLAAAIGVALGGLGAAIVVWLYLRWIHAPALVLFEGARPRDALRASSERTRGDRGVLLGAFALWLLLVAGVGFALWLLDALCAPLVLDLAGSRPGPNVFAVSVLLGLELAAGHALGFLWFNVHQLLAVESYARSARRAGASLELPAPALAPRRRAPMSLRAGILLGAAALLGIGAASTWRLLDDATSGPLPASVAHRGSSLAAPENTLAAVRQAIEDGADLAEIDVQETADGVIVVLHDADLMRLAGDPRKIWELRHADLSGLDVGGWFAPGFAGEQVPTLAEVIGLARGRIGLLIELKYNGHDVKLAERVAEVVRREGFGENCAVMSLEAAGLERLKRELPGVPVGLTVAVAVGDLARVDADFLAINAGLADRDLLARARRAGKPVWVWTVNDEAGMLRALALGVDAIISDDPARLRAVRADFRERSPVERLLLAYRFVARS